MSDRFDLSRLFNPETLRQTFQQTEQAAQPPQFDVPVRVVPPPITLKGVMKFQATFPFDIITGQSYEQIVQKILNAVASAGLAPNPALPEVWVTNIETWREEVGRPDSERPIGGTTVPTTGGPFQSGGDLINSDPGVVFRAEQNLRDALAGLREDGPGGGEEHLADPDEGVPDGSDDRG